MATTTTILSVIALGFFCYSLPLMKIVQSKRHKLYLVKTFHCRFKPKVHAFKYPLFYVGVRLDGEYQQRPWIAWNRFGLLSIRESDYLSTIHTQRTTIAEKLQDHLEQLGIVDYDYAELVTTPRFMGFSFNPLTMYYVYRNEQLIAVLLEVNNTFGEKHLYLCDRRNEIEPRKGFTHSYFVHRSFHVSPFNNRTGAYECNFEKKDSHLNVLLHIREYHPDDSPERSTGIHLTAGVGGDAYELDWRMIVHLMTRYPLNCLLTLPRIMWEAGKLTYRLKLSVFQRPNPNPGHGDGSTIVMKQMSPFQEMCKAMLFEHLEKVRDGTFVFHLPNKQILEIGEGSRFDITVRSCNYFSWYALYMDNCALALYMAILKGDVIMNAATLHQFAKAHSPDGLFTTKLNVDVIERLQSSLLSSHRTKIWIEVKKMQLERLLFKHSAEFVPGYDPWNMEQRSFSYLTKQPQVEPKWDGLKDLPDTISGIQREKIRASYFLSAVAQ
jgi:DUF1365 family protein